jgi:hypothetical protein
MGFETKMTNEQIAATVDSTGKVFDKSGAIFGEITEATYKTTPNGAGFVSISIKADDGTEVKFCDFCVTKRDGSDNYAMAFYHAMCNFTGIQPSAPAQSQKTGKFGFPYLYGKKIGLGVQIEWRNEFDDKGYQRFNRKVVSVFDYATKKSARELSLNLPATKWQEPIADEGQKLGKQQQNFSNPVDDFFGAPQGQAPLPAMPFEDEGDMLPF